MILLVCELNLSVGLGCLSYLFDFPFIYLKPGDVNLSVA